VTIRYGGSVVAAENVSLEVAEGKTVALLGANGAGKTSILRAVGGLLSFHRGQVTQGDIRFAGSSTVGCSANRIVADGVGQALEGRRVFADLTVAENLTLGAFSTRKGAASRRQEVVDLLPRLGERLEQAAGTLSLAIPTYPVQCPI
jgi:branched-chain amino acid transport system ATP-binding protein